MHLGVDYGTKRVGIAVSDEEGRVAFPLEVVPRAQALERLEALAHERKAAVIVIGESKNFSGADNPLMEGIRRFKEELQKRLPEVSLRFEPEFMTSAAAARHEENEEKLDASAAALILQSFLDRKRPVQ